MLNRKGQKWGVRGRAGIQWYFKMSLEQDMSAILVSPETTARKSAQESWDGATSRSEEDRADKEGEVGSHDAITIAQLKARVEQQSSLIGMLKQRNDETFREVKP